MQGLNSLNASADAARTLLKDKSGDGFLGAAKDAGEGVLREGTSVVLGLSTLGAYAVGGQIPPGSDKQLSVPETAAQAVDWEGISAAWKSGHPWKAIGIGIGVAAGAAGGGPGKAGKAARAEAEAGAGLRGEARAAGESNRLPKADEARIDPRKLGDYALNPNHPGNKSKWRGFDQLGYDVQSDSGRQAASDDVMDQIRAKLPTVKPRPFRDQNTGLGCRL